jgi:hypothetical protein
VALQWQREYCPDVQFLLKTDDDTVVDLDRLQWWIDNDFSQRTAQHPSAVFGGLWRGVRAIRSPEHKWSTFIWFLFLFPYLFPGMFLIIFMPSRNIRLT